MKQHAPSALETALEYHSAWTGGDFEHAMTLVAGDIACKTPAGLVSGAAAFRDFMEPFTRILVHANIVAALGDETTALLLYDTQTVPVADAPGAECLTVRDGKIVALQIIFDRLPFENARRAAPPEP